jgi:hypothetical protein
MSRTFPARLRRRPSSFNYFRTAESWRTLESRLKAGCSSADGEPFRVRVTSRLLTSFRNFFIGLTVVSARGPCPDPLLMLPTFGVKDEAN